MVLPSQLGVFIMGHSIAFLTGSASQAGRKSRKTNLVVQVEIFPGMDRNEERFQELDADDFDHAVRIAERWVDMHGATSAAIRPVKSSGAVGGIMRMVS